MFWRIWVPSPSSKRPPENRARSQATYAVSSGLRTNASATLVRMVIRSVCSAASNETANASWIVSATCRPSYPMASIRCA